jgi:hypothetical protein
LLSDQRLRKAIADLTIIERESFQKRRRFAFIMYLAAVLEFYSLLKRNNCAKRSVGRIAKLFGIRTQKRTHPIRIIIDATSAAPEKSRQDLTTYFSQIGGVAGAARGSALHPRNRIDRGRLDMAVQVPKGPLIVNVDILEPGQLFARGGRVFRHPDASESDPHGNREAAPPRSA